MFGRFLLRSGILFLLALMLASGANAQAPPARDARALLETGRLELTQVEAALQRETLDDKRLSELRTRLDPIALAIEQLIQREQPRADEVKARLDRLGPAPEPGKGITESADVVKDRAEQQKAWQEIEEPLRLARALALRVQQLQDAISERRRENFARAILKQGPSLLAPSLWLDVSRALPQDAAAFRFLMRQWVEAIVGHFDWYEMVLIAVFFAVAFAGLPKARNWIRSGSFAGRIDLESEVEPKRIDRVLVGLRRVLLTAVAPAILLYLLLQMFRNFGLLPGRTDSVMVSITNGIAFVFGMSGLAAGVLSPFRSQWRLFMLPDRVAIELWRTIGAIATILAVAKVFEAVQSANVASLPLTVVTKGLFAVLLAARLMHGLRRAFRTKIDEKTGEIEDRVGSHLILPRLIGWIVCIVVILAALFGYVALAAFLVQQIAWLLILTLVSTLILVLIEEMIGSGLSSRGALGRRLREATGLAAGSLDQASVLVSGLASLIVYVSVVMLALAPWGVDSSNLFGNLRAAFFGFEVGGVTISLSTIALALVLFLGGILVTKAIQNWLDTHYLPHTGLDIGLRNSIRTIFGYVGFIIAASLALGQAGFSLDKIAIVAGALSVGIGFGLQSIVGNFVSGLILLWERPIRVGDWIVVGEEQGTVKRINVRATEIQTFDRASLIIPNSEFIGGRVKNWMHSDRTGRIIIPINVDYESDPDQVQQLLRDAALAHREVMSEPAPIVIFKNLGESGLDFELRCFCDVDAMLVTRSELLFDIFRRLRAAKIEVPYPTRRLEITNMPGTGAGSFVATERSPEPPKSAT
ncbi:DUF3772 domain-containing protein [Rhabdaerophilum sp. SD176]|uniref:DUF3772 domain-containing protein n=1 Tax=Rhabdaerophilum sp. SD176 TaxID=2983548 RepID=UPI0024DF711F|nr:DUF3772 domain-containing protein [Rhabdaerophilum sp. SD176]